jgi:cytidylate kinase
MPVIVMTREMGVFSHDVAIELASVLKLHLIEHDVIEHHVADRLGVDFRLLHQRLMGSVSRWDMRAIDPKRIWRCSSERVVLEALRGDVLIHGWAGAQVLRDMPQVVRVRVCAPMQRRLSNLMRRACFPSPNLAERAINRSDMAYTRAVLRCFGLDWREPTQSDVVLNTGVTSVSTCVQVVYQLASCPEREASPTFLSGLKNRLVLFHDSKISQETAESNKIGRNVQHNVQPLDTHTRSDIGEEPGSITWFH